MFSSRQSIHTNGLKWFSSATILLVNLQAILPPSFSLDVKFEMAAYTNWPLQANPSHLDPTLPLSSPSSPGSKKHRQEHPIFDTGQPVFIQHPQSKCWTDQGTIIGFGQNCQVCNRHFLKPDLSIRCQLPAPEPSAQTLPTLVVPDTSADLSAQLLVLCQSLQMCVKPIHFPRNVKSCGTRTTSLFLKGLKDFQR